MKHLNRDELRRLLQNTRNDRDRVMLLVGYFHGLRASEIVGTKPGDKGLRGTSVRDGYITVQRLKGSNKTTQPLITDPEPIFQYKEQLEELAAKAGKDFIFPMGRFGLYQVMHRAGKRAALPAHKIHPHSLKHSCGMNLVSQVSINILQNWLGHASLASTGEYTKVSDQSAGDTITALLNGTRS